MRLAIILLQKRATILERWFNLILETYPERTAALIKKDKDRFTNPVGSTISREIETLFDALVSDLDPDRIEASLEAIIKIRSVQDFPASSAVGIVFLLKKVVFEALSDVLSHEGPGGEHGGEWFKLQCRVDDIALRAFDIYSRCREKIAEIRIEQANGEKEIALRMLQRMSRSSETLQREGRG
jgi:hypothetical protein